MKSKTTAGILGILLGCFGANFFYLGNTMAGILSIVFCWTGIPGIIGLVKGIQYLCMSDDEFSAKYNA